MEIHRVDAGKGWEWVTSGWSLFIKSPGIWVVLLLIFAAIAIVLQFIPLIGSLLWSVGAPALSAGMLYGAQQLDQGETLEIGHLFRGFQDKSRTGPLITLGLINVAATFVFLLIGGASMMSMMGLSMEQSGAGAASLSLSIGGLLGFLFALLILLTITMAMIYAVPLVMFTATAPVAALKLSVLASLKNWLPLLILGIAFLILSFIAAIPMGLGFLILMPMTFCIIYSSYRDIFAAPVEIHTDTALPAE